MKNPIPILLLIGVVALGFAQETGSIAGLVTDSVTTNPIVGARVNAMGGMHQRGYGITNENGEYLIENLPVGTYQVSAGAQGYVVKHYPEPVAVVAGQTTSDIDFALAPMPPPPQPGSISGVVTDSATGNPIMGARVNAMGGMHQPGGYAITNQNGEYLIENLLPGTYHVTAMAQGYSPKHYPEPVTVVEGQTTPNINFALVVYTPPPPSGISGVVTDSATGNPIVGARVDAMGGIHQGGGHAVTNQNGEYTIGNLRPGSYTVRAGAPSYIMKVYPEPVVVVEGQITPNINFALAVFVPPQPGTISGIVTDSTTGNPIGGAVVTARTMMGNHHHSFMGRAITNPDGTYLMENLPPGDYRVMANAMGYIRKAYPNLVTVTSGQNTRDINFALTPIPQYKLMKNPVRPPTTK